MTIQDSSDERDPRTHRIIGCAMEVHRQLGPGLLEATYEEAMCIELTEQGISYVRQAGIPVFYKGHLIGEHRTDLVIEDTVVVEVKSVERLIGVHQAPLLAYMRLLSRSPSGYCSTSTVRCCEPASGASLSRLD